MVENIVKALKDLFQNDGFTFDRRNGYSSKGQLLEFKIVKENRAYRITVQEVNYKLLE